MNKELFTDKAIKESNDFGDIPFRQLISVGEKELIDEEQKNIVDNV